MNKILNRAALNGTAPTRGGNARPRKSPLSPRQFAQCPSHLMRRRTGKHLKKKRERRPRKAAAVETLSMRRSHWWVWGKNGAFQRPRSETQGRPCLFISDIFWNQNVTHICWVYCTITPGTKRGQAAVTSEGVTLLCGIHYITSHVV